MNNDMLADPPQQRSPLDNTTAETGIQVVNVRKASAVATNNVGTIYQNGVNLDDSIRGEIIDREPVVLVESSHLEDVGARTEPKVLSCLNGWLASTPDQIEDQISFLGFARGETPNEHVRGNKNGAFAVLARGVITIVNTGIKNIASGARVRIRVPTEQEAALQTIVGRVKGKALMLTEEYKPEFDDIGKKTGFVTLAKQLGAQLAVREREPTAHQNSVFGQFWKAQLMFALTVMGTMLYEEEAAKGAQAKVARDKARQFITEAAKQFGLLNPTRQTQKLQLAALNRTFAMTVRDGVPQEDINQLFFSLPKSGAQQSVEETTLAQLQASIINNVFGSIISGHARVMNSIIGKTTSGGVPGGSMDLCMSNN